MTVRVLLLEDSSEVARATTGWLEDIGWEVVHAVTLAEARAAYAPDLFDLILCDYELPDGNGLEFVAGIRGSDKAKVVLWSGLDRSREVAASGLHLDGVYEKMRMVEALDAMRAMVESRPPDDLSC